MDSFDADRTFFDPHESQAHNGVDRALPRCARIDFRMATGTETGKGSTNDQQ